MALIYSNHRCHQHHCYYSPLFYFLWKCLADDRQPYFEIFFLGDGCQVETNKIRNSDKRHSKPFSSFAVPDAIFHLKDFRCGGVPGKFCDFINDLISMEGVNERKQDDVFGVENWGRPPITEHGFRPDDLTGGLIFCEDPQQDHQLLPLSDDGLLDNQWFDALSPSFEACLREIANLGEISAGIQDIGENNNEENHPHTLTSAELLKSFGSGFEQSNGDKIIEPTSESTCVKEPTARLSTEEIMRFAGKRFIQSYSQTVDIMPTLGNPFDLSLSGLSSGEIEDVELVDIFLASAEKVSNQEYEHSRKLLSQCDRLSSSTGNPVQRVVYYFSEALREKIDRESKGSAKELSMDILDVGMPPTSACLALFKDTPFCRVEQFAAIQAIVENVGGAKRIRIIDLHINIGVQWTLLMQALASQKECPLESLNITAMGPCERQMESAGKWLKSFAETLKLPFSFTMVVASDMFELKEDEFEIDAEETVAVYSAYFMWTMIPHPDRLDSLMKLIRKLNPCIMVIVEVDSNLNSPDYASRFTEALFFYSAYFDCFDDCMAKDDQSRLFTESILSQGIKSVVVGEGVERKARLVKIDVWRAFLSRFGMEEKDLSMFSLCQAYLIVKNFACAHSCTLVMNGKSLIIGWKGTPIISLSLWKFV